MGNIKKALITFSKAQFSAWLASAIDFAITIVLSQFCGLWYGYATFFGALGGGIANCVINYRWVFHAIGMKKKAVGIRYFFVWTVSILLNTLGTFVLTELSGLNFILVKAAVSVSVAITWNYQMQRLFVFKKRYEL
ncbi:MAG TPA: GtrA family protein [Prevotella sp.]